MPSERFFLKAPYQRGDCVFLEETEHHHLSKVMRMAPGEEIELVNGEGSLAIGRIQTIEKRSTQVEIVSLIEEPLSPTQLIAAVPLMRPSKLEWVIEKGTELGAHAFLLYCADYSEKENLSDNQRERLNHLIISALKQSGRLYLPSLEILPDLSSIFHREALFLFGDFRPPLLSFSFPLISPLVMITGPEKGFSPKELSLLDTKAKGIKLNSYILRAETAPIAALSILTSKMS